MIISELVQYYEDEATRGNIPQRGWSAERVSYEIRLNENGELIERACTYIADFVYFDEKGNLVVEDTKGMRTDTYIIKRKLMLHVHGIRIHEV